MQKEETILNEGNQGNKDTCSHLFVEAKRVHHMNMKVDRSLGARRGMER
jgi:hypothetical protein